MKWRFYQPDDHALVAEWWHAWKHPVLPQEALPDTGFIISNQGHDCCAVWLYRTDSSISWLEWYVANPFAPKKARVGTIEYMADVACAYAKTQGFTSVFSNMTHRGLIKRLESIGFEVRDTNVTDLIRIL